MATIYTAKVTTTGGREGNVKSDDNNIDLKLVKPGTGAAGSNPEQLFAAGYSACFCSAVEAVAKKHGTDVGTVTVNAEVTLNKDDASGFSLGVMLDIQLPGLDQAKAEEIVKAADKMCPYSKATRGNIEVTLKVNSSELQQAA